MGRYIFWWSDQLRKKVLFLAMIVRLRCLKQGLVDVAEGLGVCHDRRASVAFMGVNTRTLDFLLQQRREFRSVGRIFC